LLVTASPDAGADLFLTPDFVGHTLDEASRSLAESPMRFGKVTTAKKKSNGTPGVIDTNLPAATPGPVTAPMVKNQSAGRSSPAIVRQSPGAGQKVPAGTLINFEVIR
jgi:beta-lactam-binding protein with PASTA domain